MKVSLALMFVLCAITAASYGQLNIKFEKYVLPNGLQVILH